MGLWCCLKPKTESMPQRIASRTSLIIKASKHGSNIVATVTVIEGIYAQYISSTFLSARDLEEINKLIDDKTCQLIKVL